MSILARIAPIGRAAGFDIIWFAVYVMIVNEMVQITPPIGLKLFELRGVTGRMCPLRDCGRGACPAKNRAEGRRIDQRDAGGHRLTFAPRSG